MRNRVNLCQYLYNTYHKYEHPILSHEKLYFYELALYAIGTILWPWAFPHPMNDLELDWREQDSAKSPHQPTQFQSHYVYQHKQPKPRT